MPIAFLMLWHLIAFMFVCTYSTYVRTYLQYIRTYVRTAFDCCCCIRTYVCFVNVFQCFTHLMKSIFDVPLQSKAVPWEEAGHIQSLPGWKGHCCPAAEDTSSAQCARGLPYPWGVLTACLLHSPDGRSRERPISHAWSLQSEHKCRTRGGAGGARQVRAGQGQADEGGGEGHAAVWLHSRSL